MFSFAQFLLNLGAQLENEHSWEKIRINWTICTFLQLWSWSSSLSSYIMQNHYRCHHNHCCHHHHHRPTGIFQNLRFSLPALWCLIPIFLINASFQIRYWTRIFMHTKLIVVFGFVLVDLWFIPWSYLCWWYHPSIQNFIYFTLFVLFQNND